MLTSHVQFDEILKNWQARESNQRPLADRASALPTELACHHAGGAGYDVNFITLFSN